jgi:uncharacterized membrane protein YbhN (UPF0104 family)
MHLFLGYYPVSLQNLPEKIDEPILSYDIKGFAILSAVFSAAMVLLCVLVAGLLLSPFIKISHFIENVSYTLFWFIIFLAFAGFILLNGEEFVRQPKLKLD